MARSTKTTLVNTTGFAGIPVNQAQLSQGDIFLDVDHNGRGDSALFIVGDDDTCIWITGVKQGQYLDDTEMLVAVPNNLIKDLHIEI